MDRSRLTLLNELLGEFLITLAVNERSGVDLNAAAHTRGVVIEFLEQTGGTP